MTAARPGDRGSCSGATPYVFRAPAETTARPTAEIADRLHIAQVTVRRHISELVHKLGVGDRSALIDPPEAGLNRLVSDKNDVQKT